MIGCTNLILRTATVDSSRPTNISQNLHYAGNHGPVIVWSVTKKCNLACSHCYIDAADAAASDELNTDEAQEPPLLPVSSRVRREGECRDGYHKRDASCDDGLPHSKN